MKLISGILILVVSVLSILHGWGGVTNNVKPEEAAKIASWGIGKPMNTLMSFMNIIVAILILFPKTFFWGNILGAALIVLVMGFQLSTNNLKAAIIEIPFLLLPLVLIWLGHPLKK
jgi:hypothetical protein